MAFCFDLVLCSLFASWFGVMTITLKRKCICASPLSSLFLWPFKIDTPCCSLHFTAHCIWWWWCICSGGCDWLNSFMLCHTITWFYCLIFMSLKICQSPCLHLCFFLLKTLLSLHLFISPSPLSILFTLSLCLFFWLAFLSTLLSLPHSPSFSLFLSLCCFDSDTVIRLSILIFSCQCSAVHSELQVPPAPSLPSPTIPSISLSLQHQCWCAL